MIYDRKSQAYIEEIEYGGKGLAFLYHTLPGRILLKTIAARPWFSNLSARKQKSKASKKDIVPFIEKYNVDMTGYNIEEFSSFRDFFTRKRAYETDTANDELMAIADSKLTIYPITKDLKLSIKESVYDLKDILADESLSNRYAGGTCMVYRLAVSDYHRYVFLDDGEVLSKKKIKGELHTVRSISKDYKVYQRNTRQVSRLMTKHFGEVVMIEVGAMLVGRINDHDKKAFQRLEEKGFFDYGGSTIVMLYNVPLKIDADILEENKKGNEVKVTIGEKIGERLHI